MTSVKMGVARMIIKYAVTNPRSWITRLAVLIVQRRAIKLLTSNRGVEAIPAVRGSRLPAVVGIIAVAGGIILVVRRTSSPAGPGADAPFPSAAAAAAPPETRDAAPTSPITSPAAEAAAGRDVEDHELVAKVEAKLSGEAPETGVEVVANAGVITLRGRVADEAAESRIVRDAEAVEGVKAVQSELQTAAGGSGPAAS